MFDLTKIKTNARKHLRKFFWPALFVCLVALFLGDNVAGTTRLASFTPLGILTSLPIISSDSQFLHAVKILLLVIVFQFFVTGPLFVGQAHFFIRAIKGDVKVSNLFVAFRLRHYWNIAFVSLVVFLIIVASFILPAVILILEGGSLLVLITSLLLSLPGIYLVYGFRLVPYFLADNPQMSLKEVFALNAQLAFFRPSRIFRLDFSFLGWYLLAALAFGIGIFFVMPYHQTAIALYYMEVKQTGGNDSQALKGYDRDEEDE